MRELVLCGHGGGSNCFVWVVSVVPKADDHRQRNLFKGLFSHNIGFLLTAGCRCNFQVSSFSHCSLFFP